MTRTPSISSGYQNVVILTGAGVSAGSGLATFRRPSGHYSSPDIERLHHVDQLPGSAADLWALWGPVRLQLTHARPNAAHEAIVQYQRATRAAGGTCHVVTQNVDDLHQRAGTVDVAAIHGTLTSTRCSQAGCSQPPWPDTSAPTTPPRCPTCDAVAIPDMVLFGEPLRLDAAWATKRALRECDLFIAVGTSGTVAPASGYVRHARDVQARTVLVNVAAPPQPDPYFTDVVVGPAEQVLPELLAR